MQETKPKFRIPISLILCTLSLQSLCQHTPQTSYEGAPNTPSWASLMYENPQNVDQIRDGYEEWRKDNPDVKNQHSQYYKRWLRQADWSIPSADEAYIQACKEANLMRSGEWSQIIVYDIGGRIIHSQNGLYEVSVEGWNDGIYIVEASIGEAVIKKRLVVCE